MPSLREVARISLKNMLVSQPSPQRRSGRCSLRSPWRVAVGVVRRDSGPVLTVRIWVSKRSRATA